MKILLICQYYEPEPFRVHALCRELVRRGHEVHVVTGMPNYPKGERYPGYEENRIKTEELNGVFITRLPIHPRKTGAVHRFWNYYSYVYQSKRFVRSKRLAKAEPPFDVVFVYQLSPVMMARSGLCYAKTHGLPVLMYTLDLWPESLLAGGIARGSAVYRLYHRISGRIYHAADRILVSSGQFSPYLRREFGIPEHRIHCLPQFAEALFQPLPVKPKGEVLRLTFAGNIGLYQKLDTVLSAAELLRDEPVEFQIVGDGSELEHIRKSAQQRGLRNVIIPGRKPVEEMPEIYARSDAMLVTMLRDPLISLTLPGKVQSYLAAGKPIIGAIDGEAARVIREADCGFCGPAEDAEALAENVRKMLACSDMERLCRNAAAYYETHFSLDRFMEALEQELLTLKKE